MGGIVTTAATALSSKSSRKDQYSVKSLKQTVEEELFREQEKGVNFSEVVIPIDICSHAANVPITKQVMVSCQRSWETIKYSLNSGAFKKSVNGGFTFSTIFFEQLKKYDGFYKQFVPYANSRMQSRNVLFLKIVNYILSVPDDSFVVKSKIRAMGRAHNRRGILEEHFTAFNQCFMISLLISFEGNESLSFIEEFQAWAGLLQFMKDQLTFDKVVFVSHNFSNSNLLNNTVNNTANSTSNSTMNDAKHVIQVGQAGSVNARKEADSFVEDEVNVPRVRRLSRCSTEGMLGSSNVACTAMDEIGSSSAALGLPSGGTTLDEKLSISNWRKLSPFHASRVTSTANTARNSAPQSARSLGPPTPKQITHVNNVKNVSNNSSNGSSGNNTGRRELSSPRSNLRTGDVKFVDPNSVSGERRPGLRRQSISMGNLLTQAVSVLLASQPSGEFSIDSTQDDNGVADRVYLFDTDKTDALWGESKITNHIAREKFGRDIGDGMKLSTSHQPVDSTINKYEQTSGTSLILTSFSEDTGVDRRINAIVPPYQSLTNDRFLEGKSRIRQGQGEKYNSSLESFHVNLDGISSSNSNSSHSNSHSNQSMNHRSSSRHPTRGSRYLSVTPLESARSSIQLNNAEQYYSKIKSLAYNENEHSVMLSILQVMEQQQQDMLQQQQQPPPA